MERTCFLYRMYYAANGIMGTHDPGGMSKQTDGAEEQMVDVEVWEGGK